jgi:hypothetical protein
MQAEDSGHYVLLSLLLLTSPYPPSLINILPIPIYAVFRVVLYLRDVLQVCRRCDVM